MRTLRWAIAAVAAVLASCGGGSDSTNSDASPISTGASPISTDASPISTDASPIPTEVSPDEANTERVYRLGDTGPGGGIIFYENEAGFEDESCLIGKCRYLEMANAIFEDRYIWKDAIIAAENYSTPSADDWVLPSLFALDALEEFVDSNFDGFFGYYWSSAEFDVSNAFSKDSSYGYELKKNKYDRLYVRPVRAFGFVSESTNSDASPIPTEVSPDEANTEGIYGLGDTGPGGGIIVYFDEAGFEDESCLIGICRYLEMANANLKGRYIWKDAMLAAENYSTPSADDWVLPSKEVMEILYIYIIKDRVKSGTKCWTSSEHDDNNAWAQNFPGIQYAYSKNNYECARPVRGF